MIMDFIEYWLHRQLLHVDASVLQAQILTVSTAAALSRLAMPQSHSGLVHASALFLDPVHSALTMIGN
jgi:hypothetical protein